MYTSAELQLLRNADPGVEIPGIDTKTGNPLALTALKTLSSLPTDAHSGVYYDPHSNQVHVMQAGVVLNGYDFGDATVTVAPAATNVTIENSNFSETTAWFAIQASGANLTVTNDTFDGGGHTGELAAWITSGSEVTVTNNSFLDTPADGVDCEGGGVISGNYFSGCGYSSNGQHPDAIWVSNSTAALSITNNFIDWTQNPGSTGGNDCIRITAEVGSVSNLTVSGNYLFGGASNIQGGGGTKGTFSNVSIANNYLGFGVCFNFYPETEFGVTLSGNVVFDYGNPVYAANAWSTYVAAGIPTKNLLVSTSGSTINDSALTGPTTLYGSNGAHLFGGLHENNFVPDGRDYIFAGAGANIFTYLSPADSPVSGCTCIGGFDPAKDVIDLSFIDANLTAAGTQNFSFIGTNAFTAAGAQVRYQYQPTGNVTLVEATLAGDIAPDMEMEISGGPTLTAANFALTSAQSNAGLADGAALAVSSVRSGSATEYLYTNVVGRAYSSYASINNNGVAADDLNLSAASNEIDLLQSNVTITRGAGESLTVGTGSFTLGYCANETIQAGNVGAETFKLSVGFGGELIKGFTASGTSADTLVLPTAAFSYLNASMSQAQDLAAVLGRAPVTPSATIADSHGDILTLVGVTAGVLLANPSAVKFV